MDRAEGKLARRGYSRPRAAARPPKNRWRRSPSRPRRGPAGPCARSSRRPRRARRPRRPRGPPCTARRPAPRFRVLASARARASRARLLLYRYKWMQSYFQALRRTGMRLLRPRITQLERLAIAPFCWILAVCGRRAWLSYDELLKMPSVACVPNLFIIRYVVTRHYASAQEAAAAGPAAPRSPRLF